MNWTPTQQAATMTRISPEAFMALHVEGTLPSRFGGAALLNSAGQWEHAISVYRGANGVLYIQTAPFVSRHAEGETLYVDPTSANGRAMLARLAADEGR